MVGSVVSQLQWLLVLIMSQVDTKKLAWAAGLFEGEGCFCVKRGSRSPDEYPQAIIVMTDEDVVRSFRHVMGLVYMSAKATARTKAKWRWVANSYQEFQQTVCYFWPWLHARRRAKVKEILTAYHAVTAARNDGLMGNRRKRRLLNAVVI